MQKNKNSKQLDNIKKNGAKYAEYMHTTVTRTIKVLEQYLESDSPMLEHRASLEIEDISYGTFYDDAEEINIALTKGEFVPATPVVWYSKEQIKNVIAANYIFLKDMQKNKIGPKNDS